MRAFVASQQWRPLRHRQDRALVAVTVGVQIARICMSPAPRHHPPVGGAERRVSERLSTGLRI